MGGIHSGHRLVASRNTGPATWLPCSFFGNQTESKITKIAFLSKMVTLQFGLLSIFLLIENSLGAPQQRQDVSRSQDPLNCNDHDVYGFHCVPIFQCSNEGIIKTDARGLFDPRSTGDNCGDYDYSNGECCPPERQRALSSSCLASLDVCCLHPNSTEQYSLANLNSLGCAPNGGPARTTPGTTEYEEEVDYQECSVDECRLFGDRCCEEKPETCSEEDQLLGFCEDQGLTGVTCSEEDQLLGFCVNPPVIPEPRCGTRNAFGAGPVPETPSADEAEFGEWPHVCALLKKEDIGNGEPLKIYECGASLIDDQVLLTAAHCVKDIKPEDLIVRCGEWDTQTEREQMPYQEIQVEEIRTHQDFVNENHHNNFALLFLRQAFKIQDHIQPVCLPQPCAVYDSKNCVANGWGKDKFGSDGRYSTILKEVTYPVVDSTECQEKLRKTRLGGFFELDQSFICAGGIRGVDTCKGDGGSPLTCRMQGTNKWVQAGIVSWGIGCGEEGVPAVYANVAHVVCWIDHQVKKFFDIKESKFGFLPSVDCNGQEPAKNCKLTAQRQHNDIRDIIIEDIFAPESEQYDDYYEDYEI